MKDKDNNQKGIITYVPLSELMDKITLVIRAENTKLIDLLDDKEELLKVPELSKLLGVSRQTLHSWEQRGILRSVRIESRKFYLKSEIMELITNREDENK
jgi:predicted DNA-binding transcriptional regulator AlpA